MSGAIPASLTVLLASVLKPVDDTRMQGKFACTLRERPNVQVHIAGRRAEATPAEAAPAGTQAAPAAPTDSGIHQHPIFEGTRLSMARLAAQWRYWCLLGRVQPTVVIVHAPELLPLTLLWQRLGPGRKFLYDIRENYALNVATQGVYRGRTRRLLAAGLRWVEGRAAAAAAIVLAETSYAEELPFLRRLPAGRVVVLENKYQPAPGELLPTQPRLLPGPTEPLRLLYSGTIAELNGVEAAVALAAALHTARPGGVLLTVVGYCQNAALLQRLTSRAAQVPWLRLVGGAGPVPHRTIVAEIDRAHIGLLPYLPHASTEHCRPTKLFEYLAHGLPVLIPPNQLWQALVLPYQAGLVVDFQSPNLLAHHLLAALAQPATTAPLFYRSGIPTEVLWATEGIKLWHLLDSLI